ncbi:MAG: response regulator, partial [Candidatus Binatia bacterium]
MPRLLIADNDEPLCDSIRGLLVKEGYEVEWVRDGVAAVEALKRGDLDLVLSEVDLPGLDGLELLKLAQELSPRTLGIVMAARGSLETAMGAIRQGAQDYFLKPISASEVADRVIHLIDLRHQAEEVQF